MLSPAIALSATTNQARITRAVSVHSLTEASPSIRSVLEENRCSRNKSEGGWRSLSAAPTESPPTANERRSRADAPTSCQRLPPSPPATRHPRGLAPRGAAHSEPVPTTCEQTHDVVRRRTAHESRSNRGAAHRNRCATASPARASPAIPGVFPDPPRRPRETSWRARKLPDGRLRAGVAVRSQSESKGTTETSRTPGSFSRRSRSGAAVATRTIDRSSCESRARTASLARGSVTAPTLPTNCV